jgi:hypothetical protein
MGQKQGTYHMFGRRTQPLVSQFDTVTARDPQNSSQLSPLFEVAILLLDCVLGPDGHQSL